MLQIQSIAVFELRFAAVEMEKFKLFAEVGVVAVDPVLAGWVEDVEVDSVQEGVGFVGEVGWNAEDFAGADGDFLVSRPRS